MKRPYFFLVLILMLAGFTNAAKAQVQATARLDSTVIKIGSQTQLHLMVRQPAGQKVNFPQLADTISSKILIVNAGKLDTAADSKDPGNITVHRAYTITAFDEGKYDIPAYQFGAASGPVSTMPLVLDVRTIKVDTTKAIFDIKQPMAVSYSLWDWIRDNWFFLSGILIVLAIAIGVYYYIKNKPDPAGAIVRVEKPKIPLHVIVLGKLANLREQKLWQRDEKAYHVELSNIIRDYLEARYVIKTHEKTTAEIFASLKFLEIADNDRNMLRLILLLADMVKFAKEKPTPAENEQSMDNAIAFVNNTKQEEVLPPPPAEPAEGGKANV